MIRTHEVNLSTTIFNQFSERDYIILKTTEINKEDYVLFKQVVTDEGETKETGLYRMTKVVNVIKDDGLKDGYILLIVNKL